MSISPMGQLPPLSEQQRTDLDRIFNQYRRHLLAYCRLHCNLDPEDIVQATYERIMRGSQRGRQEPDNWRAYLYRVAQRTLQDLVHRERQTEPLDQEPAVLEPGYEALETADLQDQLRRREARPEFRRVWYLTHLEELSVDEVSERTGLLPATVKTHLHRTRALLRQAL